MDWIDELEKLNAEATPGPWESYSGMCCPDMGGVSTGRQTVWQCSVGKVGHPATIEDASLIAAMRNALPRLLAAARLAEYITEYTPDEVPLNPVGQRLTEAYRDLAVRNG